MILHTVDLADLADIFCIFIFPTKHSTSIAMLSNTRFSVCLKIYLHFAPRTILFRNTYLIIIIIIKMLSYLFY